MKKTLIVLPIITHLLCNGMFAMDGVPTPAASGNDNNLQNVPHPNEDASHTSAHSHTHTPHTSAHAHTHAPHTSAHAHTHAPHTSAHTHTHAPHSHTHAPHTSAHAHTHAPHTSAHSHTHAPHTSAHTPSTHVPHTHRRHGHTHTSAYTAGDGYEFPFSTFSDELFESNATQNAAHMDNYVFPFSVFSDELFYLWRFDASYLARKRAINLNAKRFISDYDEYMGISKNRCSQGALSPEEHQRYLDGKKHARDFIEKFNLHSERHFHKASRNLVSKSSLSNRMCFGRLGNFDHTLTPIEILQCAIFYSSYARYNNPLRRADEFLSSLVDDNGDYTPLALQIPPEHRVFALYHRGTVLFRADECQIDIQHKPALNKYNRVEKIFSKLIGDDGNFSEQATQLTPRQKSQVALYRGLSLSARRKFVAAAAVLAQFIDDNGENGSLASALLPPEKWGDAAFKRGIALVNLRKDAAAANVLNRLLATHNQWVAEKKLPEISEYHARLIFLMGVSLGNLHRCLDAVNVLFKLIDPRNGDETALVKCLPLYTRSKARFLLGESLHYMAGIADKILVASTHNNNVVAVVPVNDVTIAVLSRFVYPDGLDDTEEMSHLKSKRQQTLARLYFGAAMGRNLNYVGNSAVLSKLINDDGNCDALMASTHDNAIRFDVISGRVNSLILSDVSAAARVLMGFFDEYGNLKGNISDSLCIDTHIKLRQLCMRNMRSARKEIGKEQKTKILNIASKFFDGEIVNFEPWPEQFQNIGFVAYLTFLYASLRHHFCVYGDSLLNKLLSEFRSDPYSWNTDMFNALQPEYQQELKNMGTRLMI